MRRYYLSRVVGTGAMTDQIRSRASDLASAAGGNCQDKIADGAVAGDWCLSVVDCRDHTSLIADPNVQVFPDMTLDALLNTISAAQRNAILTFCTNHGIDVSSIKNTDAFRLLIRVVGRRFAGLAFSEDAFDVKPAL